MKDFWKILDFITGLILIIASLFALFNNNIERACIFYVAFLVIKIDRKINES